MKKKTFLKFLFFVYIILSLAFIFLSGYFKQNWMSTLGIIMLFGGPFLYSIIYIIIMFKRANKANSSKNYDAKSDNEASIEQVNTSHGIDNKYKLAKYEVGMVTSAYKNSPKKEKILGALLFIFLISLPIAAIVFAILRIYLGLYICFGVFCGSIIIMAIGKTIIEKRALSTKQIDENAPKETATVIATTVSSFNSYKTGGKRLGTSRITSIVYKVRLNVHGKEIVTYSKEFYNDGEKVKVVLNKKGNRAKIITDNVQEDAEEKIPVEEN